MLRMPQRTNTEEIVFRGWRDACAARYALVEKTVARRAVDGSWGTYLGLSYDAPTYLPDQAQFRALWHRNLYSLCRSSRLFALAQSLALVLLGCSNDRSGERVSRWQTGPVRGTTHSSELRTSRVLNGAACAKSGGY